MVFTFTVVFPSSVFVKNACNLFIFIFFSLEVLGFAFSCSLYFGGNKIKGQELKGIAFSSFYYSSAT